MITIFEAKRLAEKEVIERYAQSSTAYATNFVAVSAKEEEALICPSERDAIRTECRYIFRVIYKFTGGKNPHATATAEVYMVG